MSHIRRFRPLPLTAEIVAIIMQLRAGRYGAHNGDCSLYAAGGSETTSPCPRPTPPIKTTLTYVQKCATTEICRIESSKIRVQI